MLIKDSHCLWEIKEMKGDKSFPVKNTKNVIDNSAINLKISVYK